MRFLLPCSCGRSITIEIAQAGEQVMCSCGKSQEVPTMRGIRALAPATAEKEVAGAVWSPLQGGLFGFGAILLLVGACLSVYFAIPYWRIDTREEAQLSQELVDAEFDTLPVDQAYTVFQQAKEAGLGPQYLARHIVARQVSQYYLRLTIAALVATALGFALIIGSFIAKPRRA